MSLDTSATPLGARNATLTDLAVLLREQQARKVDVVASSAAIRARYGQLVVDGTAPVLGEHGVTLTTGTYTPTNVCDQGVADKLGIPVAYLRRTREERPDLYDANVNGWLDGDERRFLLRCLRGDNGTGIARAFLSDGYKFIDNLDVLMAVLDGVRQSGAPVQVDGCDLTERRMYVRVVCEQVRVLAPALLAGYRSPFTGASGADNPVVFAGFVITNSETGCGAFSLTPRLVVQVCRNGMTITRDAMRVVHLGERLDQGVVSWSDNTRDKTLALITAKTTDAVGTFLDSGYVQRTVRAMEKDAGHPVTDPEEAVRTVSQRLRFTEAQQKDILNHFIRGGDVTAGGVRLILLRLVAEVSPALDHLLRRTAADPQLEAAAGYEVGRTGVLCHVERVLVAHVDHCRADLDPAGARANRRQQRERRSQPPREMVHAEVRAVRAELFGGNGQVDRLQQRVRCRPRTRAG